MPAIAEFMNLPGYVAPGEDETVWRYMSLDRFVSLLSTKSLWFSSRQQLLQIDPFEGIVYPFLTVEDAMSNTIGGVVDENGVTRFVRGMELITAGGISLEQANNLVFVRNRSSALNEAALSCSVAVNCWHCDPDESAAMWKIYASSGSDIAVRSTAGRLQRSLRPKSDQTIRIAFVRYDDAPPRERPSAVFDSMLWKKRPYAYEREVRALLWKTDAYAEESERQMRHMAMGRLDPTQSFEALPAPDFHGEAVDLVVSELIEEIVVSPLIRPWQYKSVLAVLEAFGFGGFPVRSSILTGPTAQVPDEIS